MTSNDNGQERISMAARSAEFGKGGLIAVKNQNSQPTIKLIGDVGNDKLNPQGFLIWWEFDIGVLILQRVQMLKYRN